MSSSDIDRLSDYYQLHAGIYDVTRWLFLFGRKKIIRQLPNLHRQSRLLEVGCGTGKNLIQLHQKYPEAEITGVDLSESMLDVAEKKIRKLNGSGKFTLLHHPYGKGVSLSSHYDLILFSYSLTMMSPHQELILKNAYNDLSECGIFAVVDFYTTPIRWFKNWMQLNHVTIEDSLLQSIQKHFSPLELEVESAYGRWWKYFLFVGTKK